jgi:glycerol uptake facilitator-like aquaporin
MKRCFGLTSLLGKSLAEFAGTALLVAVVVGSGIMATNLSNDLGVALLINALSTILALGLLIYALAPISGAHFNPVVSIVEFALGKMKAAHALTYVVVQVAGAVAGTILANVMFDQPAIQISAHSRFTTGTLIGEVLATAGLVALIGILVSRNRQALIPVAVAAWIGSAYFFTSSTSFANPAVTVGRIFTDTFAGIAPTSVLPFVAAQLIGAIIGMLIAKGIKIVG